MKKAVTTYDGELLAQPQEGERLWVHKKEALDLPMQDWFRRRFPLFLFQVYLSMILYGTQSKSRQIMSN